MVVAVLGALCLGAEAAIISFSAGISAFIPTGPTGANAPIISPFFGDVDTRTSAGVLQTSFRLVPSHHSRPSHSIEFAPETGPVQPKRISL
jgi:hypothetical protein